MSEFDLSSSLAAARKEAERAARTYVDAQAALADASDELTAAKAKLDRIERAIAVLNGEEPAMQRSAAATAPSPAAPAPAAKPKPQPRPELVGPKCGGCQSIGTLSEIMRPTKNNTMVRMLVCSECANEVYLG